MDEPKEQPGATPPVAPTGTSKTAPVFTKEQVDTAERKGRSDALAEIGRLRVAAEAAMKTAQAADARVKKMLEEQEKAEIEAARDDPPKLLLFQARQKGRQVEEELAKVTLELNQKSEQLKEAETERAERNRDRIVQEVSTRFNVDPARLAKLARFTAGTPEAIEDLAKDLSPKPPLKPDSGGALGGSPSWEEVRGAYIKNPRDPAVKQRYLQMRGERRGT